MESPLKQAPSHMLQEAGESADTVARLLEKESHTFAELGRLFRDRRPPVVTTAARGSSDHAATFFKYLFEIHCGLPVASIGPSVASVYETPLRLKDAVHLTVSQSGASPDILAVQAAAKRGGAVTVAVVNVADSPLAREADIVLALHAGEEKSVAATKSFIASAAALAGVTAAAADDAALRQGLAGLPRCLRETEKLDWQPASQLLAKAGSLYVSGRGPAFAVALEAALKAKETAGLHAEAFSLAELMHGPMRLVDPGFPVLAFVSGDAAFEHSRAAVEKLLELGAAVASFSSRPLPGLNFVTPTTGNGFLDPIASLLFYYRLIEAVTREKGLDPDRPSRLRKVTETV